MFEPDVKRPGWEPGNNITIVGQTDIVVCEVIKYESTASRSVRACNCEQADEPPASLGVCECEETPECEGDQVTLTLKILSTRSRDFNGR